MLVIIGLMVLLAAAVVGVTGVLTNAGAGDSDVDSADLEAFITVTGTTEPLALHATVRVLDDGAVRVGTDTTIDHDALGLHWNEFFMLSRKTTIAADTVFQRSTAASETDGSADIQASPPPETDHAS